MMTKTQSLLIPAFVFTILGLPGHLVAQDAVPTSEQEAEIRRIAEEVGGICPMPTGPVIPDGSRATQDDMVSAQQALKTYIENGNTYLGCLEDTETQWGDAKTVNQAAVINYLYNAIVEDLQNRADAFNEALAAFRDRTAD